MIMWEYKFDKFNTEAIVGASEAMEAIRLDWLNKLGDEGWELVKLDYFPSGTYVVMKRGRTG